MEENTNITTEVEVAPIVEESAPTSEEVMVNYDASTGEIVADPNSTSDKIKEFSEAQFNSFISNGSDLDLTGDIKDFLAKYEQDGLLKNVEDITVIAELIKRSYNGEKIDAFKEFPASMKQQIIAKANTMDRRVIKTMANAVLKEMVEDYKDKNIEDLDAIIGSFANAGETIAEESSKKFGDILMDIDANRREQIELAIEECKKRGSTTGVEKFEKMRDSIDSAYNLKDFAQYCKRVKIKNYELERPEKVFRDFNMKYIDHTYNINDITYCPSILDRHLGESLDNTRLCIAFCKYAQNMSPDNIEEHTFMYYFIRNIITIDKLNPKGKAYDTMTDTSKAFYDTFINNLKTCIEHINTRLINVVK